MTQTYERPVHETPNIESRNSLFPPVLLESGPSEITAGSVRRHTDAPERVSSNLLSDRAAVFTARRRVVKRLRWILTTVVAISMMAGLAMLSGTRGSPEQAKASDAFVDSIGVNTHMNYFDTSYGDYPIVKQRLAALGVRHIRDKAHLSGNARYNETVYGMYRELAGLGIRSNLIVDPRSPGLGYVNSQKIESMARMAGNALESFEGPNEYDLSGVSTWAENLHEYQEDLYTSVKDSETTSDIPVLAPALAHHSNAEELGYLGAYLDYGNMHPYPDGELPASQRLSKNLSDTRKVSGDNPIVVTETGYHNALSWTGPHAGVSARAAGKYVPRTYLEYFNRGIERTFYYELMNPRPDPTNDDREKNFGLLRNDGSHKPAYTSLKNLIHLLEDPGPAFKTKSLDYSLTGETSRVHRTLLQKRDGSFYLVLWQERPSYDQGAKKDIAVPTQRVRLNLNQPVSRTVTYLPNVSTSPKRRYVAPKRLTLNVPDHPLVIEMVPRSE